MKANAATLLSATLSLICLLAGGPSLSAQTGTSGTIIGTITDESGGVIPGATVEVVDVGTNTTRTVVSGSRGEYAVPNLSPGDYRITISLQGFRTTVLNTKVEVARSVLANIALKVGAVAETVQVSGSIETELQTTDASVNPSLSILSPASFGVVTRQAGNPVAQDFSGSRSAPLGFRLEF